MFGFISWAVLIAIFYFFPVLAIISLFIAFILAPVLVASYVVYKFAFPPLKRKFAERSKRREMRKRIKAMLRKNLRYLP